MRIKKGVYLESLGCNKNTVDSEIILSLLRERGYIRTTNPEDASCIIVNTCAFIDDAKRESIDVILGLARYRKAGRRLIVTGCLSQLHPYEIEQELPEVDAIIGVGDLRYVVEAVERPGRSGDYSESRIIPERYREYAQREEFLTPSGYAYVKISEGCSRGCSFCLIPHIKGEHRSRRIEDIVKEVRGLEERGIKEIIITSQDTLSFGEDLGIKGGLRQLISRLIEKTSIPRIRLLYLRPAWELLDILEVFEDPRVLPYFDIPIQHASKKVLVSMKRSGDSSSYMKLIDSVRERLPDAVLRTTVMVGFPGEDEGDFRALLNFVKKAKFHHLGVFVFSPQKETEAYKLKGRVNRTTGERRKSEIMLVQQGISRDLLQREVGKVHDVLIDELLNPGVEKGVSCESLYLGRSFHFAPEVDGFFLLRSSKPLKPGSIIRAKVTEAECYDLHGIAMNDD
jgi:ribosomal protein S12 methylthiotransferase